jgi:hypothetical protein
MKRQKKLTIGARMKVKITDAHDRFKHFTKQNFSISECCDDLIKQRPFGDYPFYIFAHTRTDDDGVTKRLIWQPRLTKPVPQTNSMLFKAYPGNDNIKVIWILPAEELWAQFELGKMTENVTILESIWNYKHLRRKMAAKEPDDFDDEKINSIYQELSVAAKSKSVQNVVKGIL